MRLRTLKNVPLNINLNDFVNIRDWTLSGDTATHAHCNTDSMQLISKSITAGSVYKIAYEVISISGGYVQLSVGGVTLPQETTVGHKTTEITTLNSNPLTFTSNADAVIGTIDIVEVLPDPTSESEDSITWGEKPNRWVSFRSYNPESGFSMFTDMFTYRNGELYLHKDSTVRNNFYGNQYETLIKFPSGAISVKNYASVAIHSNIIWATTTDGITTQLGHVSDLIETDFENREGIYYANFLRDKLTDIVNGDILKGRYIVMELKTVDGSKKLQLFKVIIKHTQSTANE